MNETSTNLSRRTVAIGAVLGALAASGQALAAECPADKRGTDVMGPGATKPKGVSDKLRGAIDLADEKVKLPGYKLRLRQLVIEPGGEVPWQPCRAPGDHLHRQGHDHRVQEHLRRAPCLLYTSDAADE